MTLGNTISGAGNLFQSGTGTLTLTGANTFSGTAISAGTLQVGNGGTTGSLGSGNIVDNATLTFNRSDAVTLGNFIRGTGNLIQAGAGTLTITNANTFTGTTTINAGSGALVVGNQNALQNSTVIVNANNGLTLNGTALPAVTLGGLSGGSNFALNGTALTVGNNSTDTTFSGTVRDGNSANGSLIKVGTGTLTLINANTFSGTTTISAGTLQVGSGGTTGALGSGNITDNATLTFNRSDNVALSNAISGNGNLIQAGTGTLTLTGDNTFSGATRISAGTLVAGNVNALQNSALTVTASATLAVGEAANTTSSAITTKTINLSSLTLASAASSTVPELTFNLGVSGVSDSLALSTVGGFSGSSNGNFYFGFASATGSSLAAGSYSLVTFTDSLAGSRPSIGSFHAITTGNLASLNPDTSVSNAGNGFRYVNLGNNQYTLQFTITGAGVPEPSALALLCMGGMMVGGSGVIARHKKKAV